MPRKKAAKRWYDSDTPLSADPEVVANWSSTLPDGFIQCRDMGHTWRPYTAEYDIDVNAYRRVLRCNRCKTKREQYIGLGGLILSGGYTYPEGYQAPKGTGRIDGNGRGALRLESTRRLIDKHDRKASA